MSDTMYGPYQILVVAPYEVQPEDKPGEFLYVSKMTPSGMDGLLFDVVTAYEADDITHEMEKMGAAYDHTRWAVSVLDVPPYCEACETGRQYLPSRQPMVEMLMRELLGGAQAAR